jgi:hypothetical protein
MHIKGFNQTESSVAVATVAVHISTVSPLSLPHTLYII